MFTKTQLIFQEKLMPIACKLEQQKHLQAIKDGMMAIVPIIIIGSFCVLPLAFMNLLQSGPIFDFLSNNLSILTYPDKFTNGLLSVYAAYFIADALGKKYQMNAKHLGVMAIIVHLILSGISIEGGIGIANLGAKGLFTCIISAIMSVEITRFMINKKLVFKLPESVPEMVSTSFLNLTPMVINVILAVIVSTLSMNASGKVFPELVMSLMAPAISTMDSLPALLIIVFLTQFLWFFGLHGSAITSAVWTPFAITYGAENIAAFAAGQPVTHFFTFGSYYALLTGHTIVLVIMLLFSKAKSLNAVGKVAIIPSIFGINEPIIFGVPMILNPFMFIPFVLGPLLVTIISYYAMTLGFVGMPIANPPGFMPPGVGAFLMTMDWKAVALVFVNLTIMAVIYYPCFKAMEANELRKENDTTI